MKNVGTEMSLLVLSYNLKRVIKLLGNRTRPEASVIGAVSLLAELSIDWNTRLEGDGNDLLHWNRRVAAVSLDPRRGRQGRGLS